MAAKRSSRRTTRQGKRPSASPEARAARRERRREEQVAEMLARHRRRRRRRIRNGTLVVVAAGSLAVGGYLVFRPPAELPGVERVGTGERGHTNNPTYDTPTPTSGRHSPQTPPCQTYTEPLELGLAVHALEHGAVVLWHRPDLPADELADLQEIADRWDSHVIISPNPGIDDAVVATAWTRLKAYPSVDPEIDRFIERYRQRGPEEVDCDR